MSYTIQTTIDADFEETLAATIDALESEGFGILSDIDMQGTFEAKLDQDFRQYRILGACNPPLAMEGLTEEIDLGTLLPCNVAVYEGANGDVVVSAADPVEVLDITDNPTLEPIATEVKERLENAIATLEAA
jgi:uncharacterized protein (DUF302 family)